MKNLIFTMATLLSATTLITLNAACNKSGSHQSKISFIQTNTNSAILESRDLEDTFLFGLNVIETKGFFSTALNLNFRPVEAKLMLTKGTHGRPQLVVASANSPRTEALLTFDAKKTGRDKIEVDFATAGNDLSLWNEMGAAMVDQDAGRDAGSWKTIAKPKVVRIEQDSDSVVVDILHTVSFSLSQNPDGEKQARSGEVKIRLFLKRQDKNPILKNQTAGMAKAMNIGFFAAARRPGAENSLPIAHYKIDVNNQKEAQHIIFLKDFPEEFVEIGRKAVESWNISFGFQAFKTEIASENIDLGDPRYHVVKWIDGLDEDVPWAGYAPTMVNPLTGEVIATQILINGSTTRKGFEEIYNYTAEASPQFKSLSGKIGNVPLVEGVGENPVVSFFADSQSKSSDEYIKSYYYSVIMHEFGHSLGLRHNFAGSTKIDSNGISSSVMDYEPGFITNVRTTPGSYDTAAIRWGYFNESPETALTFCTDEDMERRFDCNQGDVGNPVNYVIAGLIQGTSVLENLLVPLPAMVEKPMRGMMKTALKILSLEGQLPNEQRERAVSEIHRALERVKYAQPASELDESQRVIVLKNLAKLASSYADVTKSKPNPIALNPSW